MSIPTDFQIGEYRLRGLDKINILVGKNGCGKSRALRSIDSQLMSGGTYFSGKRYISPERGGKVSYEPNIENNISTNPTWLDDTRRNNQAAQFRQQSIALFRQLELTVLRLIEKERRPDQDFTFDKYLVEINNLLDQVKLIRAGTAFEIRSKTTSELVSPENISSGESELISLAIECLSFEAQTKDSTESLLMLDEPDVHLHPDLQSRLMGFLCRVVERSGVRLMISTHSTPILGALSRQPYVRIFFMQYGTKDFAFQSIGSVLRVLIPVFGAHPLSSVFNEQPVLIVEGEDEERIWQQAVRSSQGKVCVYPVECGGKGNMAEFEKETETIISSIYDSASGYSLRDSDGVEESLEDSASVIRMRLNCYSSENLMLTDDVLSSVGVSWDEMKAQISAWCTANRSHKYSGDVDKFVADGFDRRNSSIKTIRNILLSLLPTNKPWEVLIGKVLAGLCADSAKFEVDGSLLFFLGAKTARALLPACEGAA